MSNDKQIEVAEKPLNQSQIKNLRELVENDFTDLNQTINNDIERRLARRKEAIENRYRDIADLEAARRKLVQAGRNAEDMLSETIREVTNGQIVLSDQAQQRLSTSGGFMVEVYPDLLIQEGRDREIERAVSAAHRLKTTASRALGREKRQIIRQVLLQGIGAGGALELVNDLPSQEDIMAIVAREMTSPENQSDLELFMDENELASAIEAGEGE